MEFIECLTISSQSNDYQHLVQAIKGRFEFDFGSNVEHEGESYRQGQLLMWDDGDYIDVDRLKYLTLSNVKLLQLDGITTPFQNLLYLNLSFNRLFGDLMGLKHMKSLKVLDISHNKLQNINEVKYIKTIEILRFHDNQIESLESICNMNQLKELWCSNNNIKWGEFIYLSTSKQLKIIVQQGNPSDEKTNIREFICGLVPSLDTLDGNIIQKKEATFLKTNDGKIMLTQARGMLTKEQKELLGSGYSIEPNDINIERRISSSPSRLDSPRGGYSPHFPRSPREKRFVSPIVLSSTPPKDYLGTPLTTRSSNSNPRNKLGPRSKIQKFKAKKNEVLNDDSLTYSEIVEYEKPIEQTHAEPIQIIRFGDFVDAPVAFSLNEDGSGYARWSKNGPIACSIDGGRMLASYRGGAIAGILDRSGAGSIMDNRGRCVLILSEQGVAKVLDKNGTILAQHQKGPSSTNSPNEKSVHRWKFDGLRFEFFPLSWELKVRLKTDKLICEFSNLSGCRLVEEFTLTKHSSNNSNDRNKVAFISNDEHEKLRDGLHDVVSKLDELLVGIKEKDNKDKYNKKKK